MVYEIEMEKKDKYITKGDLNLSFLLKTVISVSLL